METCKVPFDVNERDYDEYERLHFWESMRPWLIECGYTPYHQNYVFNGAKYDEVVSLVPSHDYDEVPQHPYGLQGGPALDLVCLNLRGRVIPAQDRLNRHVMLRLVQDFSDEYKILRRISTEANVLSMELFPGVIPVLDFLPLEGHWIVVMPRWGDGPFRPQFETIGDVLYVMHFLLKGLSFLHTKLIAHRDIKPGNIVVNQISSPYSVTGNSLRQSLRNEGKLMYCWIDFDASVMFPTSSTPAERRLECGWDTMIGGGNFTYDAAQGELDYDPFAYDVGSLGQLFCRRAQHLTPIMPMLAPFLDMMITRDIPRRFTARQALDFFEDTYATLTPAQLAAEYTTASGVNEAEYDRWADLPESFVQKWSAYHASTEISYRTKLLRWICQYQTGFLTVQCVRRTWRNVNLLVSSTSQKILKGRIVAKQIGQYYTGY